MTHPAVYSNCAIDNGGGAQFPALHNNAGTVLVGTAVSPAGHFVPEPSATLSVSSAFGGGFSVVDVGATPNVGACPASPANTGQPAVDGHFYCGVLFGGSPDNIYLMARWNGGTMQFEAPDVAHDPAALPVSLESFEIE